MDVPIPTSVAEAVALQNKLSDKDWEIFFNHEWDNSDPVKFQYLVTEGLLDFAYDMEDALGVCEDAGINPIQEWGTQDEPVAFVGEAIKQCGYDVDQMRAGSLSDGSASGWINYLKFTLTWDEDEVEIEFEESDEE
jgi:hypothetical protein